MGSEKFGRLESKAETLLGLILRGGNSRHCSTMTSWWFQPLSKILVGVKIKTVWNHHPDDYGKMWSLRFATPWPFPAQFHEDLNVHEISRIQHFIDVRFDRTAFWREIFPSKQPSSQKIILRLSFLATHKVIQKYINFHPWRILHVKRGVSADNLPSDKGLGNWPKRSSEQSPTVNIPRGYGELQMMDKKHPEFY